MRHITARLGLFEKLHLSRLGKADAKRGMFQDCATGKSLFPKQKGTTSNEQFSDCRFSFLLTEIGRFDVRRDAILENEFCLLQMGELKPAVKARRRKKSMRFSEAITCVDKQMAILLAQISLLESMKIRQAGDLSNEQSNPENLAEHIKELHIIRLKNSSEDCEKRIAQSQEQVACLLSEKIRLIESIQGRIAMQWGLAVLRIRYYYEKARTVLPELPAIAVSAEETLTEKGKSVLGYYDEVLSTTRRELKRWQGVIEPKEEKTEAPNSEERSSATNE